MTENPSQIEFYHDVTHWKTHKGIGIGKSTQAKFSNSQTSTTTITTTSSWEGPKVCERSNFVVCKKTSILKIDCRWHSFLEEPKINVWATLAQKLVNPPCFKPQWTTGWNSFTWESYFIMLRLRNPSFCWWGVYQTQCGELQYFAPFSKIWQSVTGGFARFHPNGDLGI